jgi:hypothetical protein
LGPDDGAMDLDYQDDVRQEVDQGKITVKFVTKLDDEYKVVETPFEVPSEFARQGETSSITFETCESNSHVSKEEKKRKEKKKKKVNKIMNNSVLLLISVMDKQE